MPPLRFLLPGYVNVAKAIPTDSNGLPISSGVCGIYEYSSIPII